MHGWYIHMDAARKSLGSLPANAGAAPIFGSNGPSADQISNIAQNHPAYVALGAIGPDIFFLLLLREDWVVYPNSLSAARTTFCSLGCSA
jgi:hypothetical protein